MIRIETSVHQREARGGSSELFIQVFEIQYFPHHTQQRGHTAGERGRGVRAIGPSRRRPRRVTGVGRGALRLPRLQTTPAQANGKRVCESQQLCVIVVVFQAVGVRCRAAGIQPVRPLHCCLGGGGARRGGIFLVPREDAAACEASSVLA